MFFNGTVSEEYDAEPIKIQSEHLIDFFNKSLSALLNRRTQYL